MAPGVGLTVLFIVVFALAIILFFHIRRHQHWTHRSKASLENDEVNLTVRSMNGSVIFGPERLPVSVHVGQVVEKLLTARQNKSSAQVSNIQLLHGVNKLGKSTCLQDLAPLRKLELTAVFKGLPTGMFEGYRDNPDQSHEEWTIDLRANGAMLWQRDYISAYSYVRGLWKPLVRPDIEPLKRTGTFGLVDKLDDTGQLQLRFDREKVWNATCDGNTICIKDAIGGEIMLERMERNGARRRRPSPKMDLLNEWAPMV